MLIEWASHELEQLGLHAHHQLCKIHIYIVPSKPVAFSYRLIVLVVLVSNLILVQT